METKQIYISEEKQNYSEKVLNSCLLDIEKVSNFAKTSEIVLKDKETKSEIRIKADSETLTNMQLLSKGIKNETLKYAFDKKRLNKAKRQISEYLIANKKELSQL